MTFTDADYKEMATAYTNGETLAKLASAFNVSIPTMSKYVAKGGATVRSRGQRKHVVEPALISNPNGITRDMVPNPNIGLNDRMIQYAIDSVKTPDPSTVLEDTFHMPSRVILPLE